MVMIACSERGGFCSSGAGRGVLVVGRVRSLRPGKSRRFGVVDVEKAHTVEYETGNRKRAESRIHGGLG